MPQRVPVLRNDELNDSTKLTDAMFLEHVDFRYPGLESAGVAFARGDLEGAKAAIVQHFRARKKPVWPRYMAHSAWLWSSGRGSVVERADLWLEGKLKSCWYPFPTVPFATDEDVRRHAGRQTFIPDLLTAYDETGDARYLVRMMELMCRATALLPFRLRPDFDNRFPYWAPHHDPMTDGHVLERWFDVMQHPAFRGESVMTDEFRWWMLRAAWFQSAQYLRYEGARYRDDNHHLFEYGVAPFNVGYHFPEFRHFNRMKRFALAIIRRHLDRTVFDDGTQGEHSVPYQQYILTDFAIVAAQARANGEELFTREQNDRLRKWCEFQVWATKPDGRLCELGDHVPPDLNYFLADHAGLWPSGFVKAAAARLGYTRVKPTRLLAGTWRKTKPAKLAETSKVFPHGGYVVMRDRWSKDGMYMLVSTPSAEVLPKAHNHLDPMHFVLHAFGRTLIGDPATLYYSYRPDGSPFKRGYHYSMGAHNCLIQNEDEIEPHAALGSYCVWGVKPPVVTINHAALAPKLDLLDLRYDGYNVRRWCPSCTRPHDDTNRHRRVILFLKGVGWIFIDRVTICPDDIRHHDYDQLLHFEPNTDVQADASARTIRTLNDDANVLVVASLPAEALAKAGPEVSVEPDPYMVASDFPFETKAPLVGHIRRKKTWDAQFAFAVLPYRGVRPPEVTLQQEDLPDGMILRLGVGADAFEAWVRLEGRRKATPKRLAALRGRRRVTLPDGTESDARAIVVRRRGDRIRETLIVENTNRRATR